MSPKHFARRGKHFRKTESRFEKFCRAVAEFFARLFPGETDPQSGNR